MGGIVLNMLCYYLLVLFVTVCVVVCSKLISIICSLFSSSYVMKWSDYFPDTKLQYAPTFDGRAVCYPSEFILRDYLSWRQVDCE